MLRTIGTQMELLHMHNGINAPKGLGYVGYQGDQNVDILETSGHHGDNPGDTESEKT